MSDEPNKYYIKRPDGSDIYLGPFAKEVWNLAIEAAAEYCDDIIEIGMAEDIRKLKKV